MHLYISKYVSQIALGQSKDTISLVLMLVENISSACYRFLNKGNAVSQQMASFSLGISLPKTMLPTARPIAVNRIKISNLPPFALSFFLIQLSCSFMTDFGLILF